MMTEHANEAIFDRDVDEFERQRQAILAKLIEELGTAILDPEAAEFSRIFRHAQKVLGKSDLDMSMLFKVSRPTIGRWVRGVTAPHPMLRKAAYDSLLVEAKRTLKVLRSRIES